MNDPDLGREVADDYNQILTLLNVVFIELVRCFHASIPASVLLVTVGFLFSAGCRRRSGDADPQPYRYPELDEVDEFVCEMDSLWVY